MISVPTSPALFFRDPVVGAPLLDGWYENAHSLGNVHPKGKACLSTTNVKDNLAMMHWMRAVAVSG